MKKSNKKKKVIKLLVALAIIVAVIMLVSLNLLYKGGDKIIAMVNDEKIYESEVEDRLLEVFQSTDFPVLQVEELPNEVVKILVRDIFVQKELDRRSKRYRIIKSKAAKKKINRYIKKIIREEYLDSIIKDKVNEVAVKNKYVEMINDLTGKKEVHLRHILVKTQNDAKRILRKIRLKKSFKKLAKDYSLDDITASDGGDLGYVIEDSLAKEFSDAIVSIKVGSVSKPIKTEHGWHIIKVEDIRDIQIVPFESIKTIIREELQEQEITNIFLEIIGNAKIEILTDYKEDEDLKGDENLSP